MGALDKLFILTPITFRPVNVAMGEVGVDVPEEGIAKFLQSRSIKRGQPEEDTQIFQARSDTRSYRRVVLANAMQVLLVSDPETDMAAASMDVHVGYFCDPEELPGLAHFLEHMLFFSNEKYPEEGSFTKFLAAHGGDSNAYTDSLNTNYQFDVIADHLEEALDRFAQFFICPLFVEDATSREVRAVDSENSRNLKSDGHRLSQLEDHLTSKDHPKHRFCTGNLRTLEELPKAKGIDTRAEMLKFYEDHYSSNLMCLTIYGKETLDQLQALVTDNFSAVNDLQHEVVHFRGEPCSAEHLQILVRAVPVSEGHFLKLSWPVTPSLLHYKEAPINYIAHLVGHEGPGSLLALLKQLGWADSLSAGEDSSLHFSFFAIVIELTDAGQEHMEEIVALTFQYLSILQKEGVASWIFEEIRAVDDMGFHFQDKYSPFYYTSSISANMRVYPPEDWLAGSLPRVFDSQVISRAIEQLTSERVRIFSLSKMHTDVAKEVEPWYGTQFTSERIDEALIKQWRSMDVDPKLHLPEPNAFIPTDFTILNAADSSVQVPFVLKNTKMSRLWYKPDNKFFTPKAKICMQFDCPEATGSPEAGVLTMIFADMVQDYLNAYAYSATVAGLGYGVASSVDGFFVRAQGFNSKLTDLAEKIIEVIVNFEVKEDRFNAVKEMVHKGLMNHQFRQPLDQANSNFAYLSIHKKFYYADLLEVIPDLTAEHLRQMVPRLLSRVFLECFIFGNITSKQAEDFVQHVEHCLSNGPMVKSKPAFSSQLMEQRIIRLENGANFTYPTVGLNPADENSGFYLNLQLGQDDTQLNVLVELLVLIMSDRFFQQLRTVEQLGYVVCVSCSVLYAVRGIEFQIQSTVQHPEALEVRVEAFLEQFGETLENMSQEDFQTNVNTLIKLKLEKQKNIWEEISCFWSEITEGTMKFKRPEVEAAALRNLPKQALVDFYRTYVQRDAPRRRKVSCQVYGSKHLQEYKAVIGESTSSIVKEAVSASVKEPADPLSSNSQIEAGDDSQPVVEEKVQGLENSQADNEAASNPINEYVVNEISVTEASDGEVEFKPKSRAQVIHDISAFKRGQSLYSSLWGEVHPLYK